MHKGLRVWTHIWIALSAAKEQWQSDRQRPDRGAHMLDTDPDEWIGTLTDAECVTDV